MEEKLKEWICNIDGDCLCIIGKNFINLAESDAVFIQLTEEQIKTINKLKEL